MKNLHIPTNKDTIQKFCQYLSLSDLPEGQKVELFSHHTQPVPTMERFK